MTDTAAPRFTLIDVANQLENVGCFADGEQRKHSVALIRQAAADLASAPTREGLCSIIHDYSRHYNADKVIAALIAAGVRVRA